jgi:hypothetical protein
MDLGEKRLGGGACFDGSSRSHMTTHPSVPAATKDCCVFEVSDVGRKIKPVTLSAWHHFVDNIVPVSWS